MLSSQLLALVTRKLLAQSVVVGVLRVNIIQLVISTLLHVRNKKQGEQTTVFCCARNRLLDSGSTIMRGRAGLVGAARRSRAAGTCALEGGERCGTNTPTETPDHSSGSRE